MKFDVAIVGAGVVGCAIARELARYQLNIAVFEKESDVASGASGRNSGVVHAGFNNPPGSLKARFCVEGNAGFETACRELSVPFKRTGKLVVALCEADLPLLEKARKAGEANGVPGMEIVDQARIKELEPNIAGIAALYSPSTAITSPFLYTVALAENAAMNGARFFFDAAVTRVRQTASGFCVRAAGKTFETRVLINSAGVYADRVARMAGVDEYRIYPVRGQYHILDRQTQEWLKMPVYPVPRPGASGLGVHLTPSVEGNILIGPSAEYVHDKWDHSTTREVLDQLTAEARDLLPLYHPRHIIRSYSGIRPKTTSPKEGGSGDYLIKSEEKVQGLINLVGIESPGLTAAAPIARHVSEMVGRLLPLSPNPAFNPRRKGIERFAEMTDEERERRVRDNPDYGEIVCRCEMVSRAEILEAIDNPLGVRTLAGIKYRARPMTGRCQGGYCLTRIVETLVRDFSVAPEDISVRGRGSACFTGVVK